MKVLTAVLYVADVVEVGIRADLVERAAQEELVGGDAGQIERARRHQEDLVGRGRQVVLAVAAVLEIGVDRLARLLEVEHRVAHLLHLAPERRVEAGRLEQHAGNPRITLRQLQTLLEPPDGGGVAIDQLADDVVRSCLLQRASRPQHERRMSSMDGPRAISA